VETALRFLVSILMLGFLGYVLRTGVFPATGNRSLSRRDNAPLFWTAWIVCVVTALYIFLVAAGVVPDELG
jgi:hypothetical protein